MITLMLSILFSANAASALDIHGIDGWQFARVGDDAASAEASGHAQASLTRENPQTHLPVAVFINSIAHAPDIDVNSIDSWQDNIIGHNPKFHYVVDHWLVNTGGVTSFIVHYQIAQPGPLPKDTLLLAMRLGTRLYLFSYGNAGGTFKDDFALVWDLYHRLQLKP